MISKLWCILLLTCRIALISTADGDFVCPKDHITKENGLTGALPAGATSMVHIPAIMNCTYWFDVPKGFALKIVASTYYNPSPGDGIMFDNFYLDSSAVNQIQYAVDSTVQLVLTSITGNMTFYTTYEFVDLSNLKQVIKQTGTSFNTTLELTKYYTVKAKTGDQVNLKYGSRNTGFVDGTLFEVFVFDGNDIVNSPYVGRMTDIYRHHQYEYVSTSDTVTLLNLYGSPSNSLFLGNDESIVEKMDRYGIQVIDSFQELDGYIGDYNDPDSWTTFICNDCSSFYIDSLQFDKRFENASGYIEVQGMSPTQQLPYILNYPYSQFTNMSLPQLIPTPMATFHTHNASVKFIMEPGSQPDDFATSPDKTRSVYSPQLWNPDAPPQFNYTFSDPLKVYNFSINLETIELENDGDELDVQVGSVNGLTTLDKKYTKTKMANTYISGMGRYLNLKYSGSKSSQVILSFKMIAPSDPPTTDGTTKAAEVMTSTFSSPSSSTVSTRTSRVSTSPAPITSTGAGSSTASPSSAPTSSVSTVISSTPHFTSTNGSTTPSSVETSTKGAASLLSTGFLILVISSITF